MHAQMFTASAGQYILEFHCLLLDEVYEGDTVCVYIERQNRLFPLAYNKWVFNSWKFLEHFSNTLCMDSGESYTQRCFAEEPCSEKATRDDLQAELVENARNPGTQPGGGHLPPPEIFKTLHSNFDICRNFQRIKMKFYILIIFKKSYWSFSLACSLIISLPNLSWDRLSQWFPNCGTRTTSGARRLSRWYANMPATFCLSSQKYSHSHSHVFYFSGFVNSWIFVVFLNGHYNLSEPFSSCRSISQGYGAVVKMTHPRLRTSLFSWLRL